MQYWTESQLYNFGTFKQLLRKRSDVNFDFPARAKSTSFALCLRFFGLYRIYRHRSVDYTKKGHISNILTCSESQKLYFTQKLSDLTFVSEAELYLWYVVEHGSNNRTFKPEDFGINQRT